MSHHLLDSRHYLRLMTPVVVVLIVAAGQSGCLFRKKTAVAPAAPPPPQRLVLLPLQLPEEEPENRWMAMAAPVEAARAALTSQDLELVPLWESMPVTVESAGANRSLTPEVAAYVASRMGARWAVLSDLTSVKGNPGLRVDFIPSRATLIPYRYEKEGSQEDLTARYYEAVEQFLRYLAVRPPGKLERQTDSASLKTLAEALDQEYGWTVEAQPGKADRPVAALASSNPRLAKLLFNPTLYPALGGAPAAPPKAPVVAPPPPTPHERPSPSFEESRETVAPPQPVAASKPTPQAQYLEIEIPPPKTFTQTVRLGNAPGKPSSAKATESPPARSSRLAPAPPSSRTFRLQVFSSPNRVAAENLALRLEEAGYTPTLEEVELGEKGTWFRVRLQGYPSRKVAEDAGEELVREKLIGEYWLVP